MDKPENRPGLWAGIYRLLGVHRLAGSGLQFLPRYRPGVQAKARRHSRQPRRNERPWPEGGWLHGSARWLEGQRLPFVKRGGGAAWSREVAGFPRAAASDSDRGDGGNAPNDPLGRFGAP